MSQACNLSNGNSVTAQLPVNISRENSNQNVLNRNASKIEANGILATEGARRWTPPVFLGLHVGSSTKSEVVRLLGTPKSEVLNFPEDQVFLDDKETEIILDYDNPEKIEGLLERGNEWYVQWITPERSALNSNEFNGVLAR